MLAVNGGICIGILIQDDSMILCMRLETAWHVARAMAAAVEAVEMAVVVVARVLRAANRRSPRR